MRINKNIEKKIYRYLQDFLLLNNSGTIKELLENYSGYPTLSEREFRYIINDAKKKGFLKISKNMGGLDDQITISLSKPFPLNNGELEVKIVISRPRLRELGLGNIQQRNDQIDTIDCYRTLIDSSKKILRICSPFMQYDIVDEDAFPDIIDHMSDAFNRNVLVRILTRDLKRRGEKEIEWIVKLAKDLNKDDNLTIVDYHLLNESGRILSSTHAKMIISDEDLAYIGSAELRKNSLIANFEVGCLLSGSQVIGLCEIFDTMYLKGNPCE